LDELAALAEFDDDPEAVARITAAAQYRRLDYQVQYERNERANAAERDRLRAELEAAGVTYTEEQPYGAIGLSMLVEPADEGEERGEITPQAHADCPGHAAYIGGYGTPRIIYYCADPETYGHGYRYPAKLPSSQTSNPDARTEEANAAATQARRLVILGNKAWKAAGPVRHACLTAFLARKTAPRN